ncbi:MAG: translation initiation factor IF-2 subunit beta [Candidatus Aenigmatarchaeota archaeon]|nr:MAG: translation initiation factor IF-2 subunit beta [Candidatus Aenigmarchaeota archaeon]
MEYEKLLKEVLEKVPKKVEAKERFEIPKAQIQYAGAKTILLNFLEIADKLRRPKEHFQKFMLKELATKGELAGQRLILLGNFSQETVNRKIEAYVKKYVLCRECGKPDTRLLKERGYEFIVCEACGAKHSVSD